MNNRLLKVIIFGIIIYYLYQKNNKLESETETFEKKINTDNDTDTDTMENVLLNQPTPQKSNDLIKRMTLKEASENSEFVYDIYDKMQGVIDHGITDDELDRVQGKLYVEILCLNSSISSRIFFFASRIASFMAGSDCTSDRFQRSPRR